ncbi:MAG: hypothetical protein O7J95_08890 [Planctomycetota bacterium]|nr:hypothetical protein [Planctomycetota bacterium]
MNPSSHNRQAGSLLFEVLIAITLLTIGILSFLESFVSNWRAIRFIQEADAASAALETVAEELATVNLADVYASYNGRLSDVPELKKADGTPASVTVTCFVDETQLPAALRVVDDIDGGGGLGTLDASGTYRILPVQLTLTYEGVSGPMTSELYTSLYSDE